MSRIIIAWLQGAGAALLATYIGILSEDMPPFYFDITISGIGITGALLLTAGCAMAIGRNAAR